MTESIDPSQAADERQAELDRDQAIFDLGQAVADRDQQSSDLEQARTDHDRSRVADTADDATTAPAGQPVIEAAQQRRDAHQEVLDESQDARDREQLTLDTQQDELVDVSDSVAADTLLRRFESAENRALAAHQRSEAALRRARHARARAVTIAQLESSPDDGR